MNEIEPERQPEIINRAAETWGIRPASVVPFMLSTVVSGTRDYKPNKTDCIAVLVVALNYQLNPFTKELYAMVDRGKVIPVVGVDGWSRIVNSRGNFDGAEFEIADDDEGNPVSCTCRIYCKDRGHPVAVTEYYNECYQPERGGRPGPWQSHPRRMLRHKAFIQCARIAFALTGIYDPDEAERIVSGPTTYKVEDRTPDTTPDPLLLTAGVQYGDSDIVEIPADEPERETVEIESDSVSTQELWERGEIE